MRTHSVNRNGLKPLYICGRNRGISSFYDETPSCKNCIKKLKHIKSIKN